MTAAQIWPGEGPVWDPQALVPAVDESLAGRYGAEFRALGPVWLRSDPARWLWLGGPLAVLIAAAPSPLLRVLVAVTAAVGVGLGLKWQSALEAHRHRCDAFVDTLAGEVATVLVVELPALIVEEISMGQYRPTIDRAILTTAARQADKIRRSAPGRVPL